jgi:hypothetical protein
VGSFEVGSEVVVVIVDVVVKYRAGLGVRSEFQMGIRGIDKKDLASTCKKLHPSDRLVS